jgi:hypothetical protein
MNDWSISDIVALNNSLHVTVLRYWVVVTYIDVTAKGA